MAGPRIKRERIEEYLRLEEERKSLERQARALGAQADLIEIEFVDLVREHGGKARELQSCGYRLCLRDKRGQPAWKTEFVARLGSEAAEEVNQAAPVKEVFQLEKI